MPTYLAEQIDAVVDHDTLGEHPVLWQMGLGVSDGALALPAAGGHLLERRTLYPTEGKWLPCGVCYGNDADPHNADNWPHEADQAYQYAVRRFFGNGHIDPGPRPNPVRLDFDAAGDRLDPKPARPTHLVAIPVAGGRFDLTFHYAEWGQAVSPAYFCAFEGDPPDYDSKLTDALTGLDHVLYRGPGVYRLRTPVYGNGTEHKFAARAYSGSDDLPERNEHVTVAVTAVSTGPTQPAGIWGDQSAQGPGFYPQGGK